ncbi:MAG: rod shape-determining protein MreC [Patescibacteria group bacterium]
MVRWQQALAIFILTLVLFFSDKAGFFDFGVNIINKFTVSPITKFTAGALEESFFIFKNFLGIRQIIRENLFLRSQRDFFRGEYFKLLGIEQENDFLRQALNSEKESSSKIILARIVSFDPFYASEVFLIDKGSADGVNANDAVILPGGIVVGHIKGISSKESRVLLITSAQSRVTVSSKNSQISGVVSGSASGALNLDLVLKNTQLSPGEILITSGLDGIFPADLLVGEITKITDNSAASFRQASVRPFFTLRDLKQVFVVVSK